MPAIIDTTPADGGEAIPVFESGAILAYLAEKTGRFLPGDVRGRKAVMEWLFWQVPYAIDRYVKETNRLYGVLDRRLAGHSFIAGDDYTIADMASYPWIVPSQRQQQNLQEFPNLRRRFLSVAARPATVRAFAKGEPYSNRPTVTEQGKKLLFGQTAAGPQSLSTARPTIV